MNADGTLKWEGLSRLLSRPMVQLLLIVLCGLMAYANSFHVPFTFDDESSILDNPILYTLNDFLSGNGYAYNPRRFIGYLTLALNYHFGGLNVTGYHLVNLGIHLSAALFVYALARLTLQTPFFRDRGPGTGDQEPDQSPLTAFIPLLAALLFVAHPVQTQAVTYIVQRFASLVTMFYLASVVCYVKARLVHEDTSPWRAVPWYVMALAAALLALRCKEIAATLPVIVLIYEFSFFIHNRSRKLRGILALLVLVALVITVWLFLSGRPFGQILSDVDTMSRETRTISRSTYLITQFSVIVTYLRLLILPVQQNLVYDYPLYTTLTQARPLLSLLLLGLLCAVAAHCYRRTRPGRTAPAADPLLRLVGFGIAWFFVTVSVESSIIPIKDVIFEHRLYLPSFGAFLAAAAGCALAARRLPAQRVAVAAGIVVLALVVGAFARNRVWRNDISLWKDVVAKSPALARSHHNLARAYKEAGMLDEAEAHYIQALRLDPALADPYTNLGVIFRMRGRLTEAIAMHQMAMGLEPGNPSPLLNLGTLYAMQQRFREAEEMFREVLRMSPHYSDAHYNLALLYQQQGDPGRAEQEFLEVLKIDPRSAKTYHIRGLLRIKSGRRSEGAADLLHAARLMPGNTRYAADARAYPSPPLSP